MGQGQSGLGPGGEKKGDDKKEKRRFEPPPPPTRVGKKQRRRGVDAASKLPTVTPSSKCKLRLLKLERVKDYLLMEEEFVTNQERLKPQEARAEEERTKVDDLRGTPMSVGSLEELIDDKCVPLPKQRPLPPGLCRARARHRLTVPAPRSHAIVSSSVGPEYYVNILSFVDKSQARDSSGVFASASRPAHSCPPPLLLTLRAPWQLEPGCSVLLHSKSMSVVGILSDEADPMVSVMKARHEPALRLLRALGP
jgi:26S proteasome regulatory subunit T2